MHNTCPCAFKFAQSVKTLAARGWQELWIQRVVNTIVIDYVVSNKIDAIGILTV